MNSCIGSNQILVRRFTTHHFLQIYDLAMLLKISADLGLYFFSHRSPAKKVKWNATRWEEQALTVTVEFFFIPQSIAIQSAMSHTWHTPIHITVSTCMKYRHSLLIT